MAANASESDTDSTDPMNDDTICAHVWGGPHGADFMEYVSTDVTDGDGGKWIPVCGKHADPKKAVRKL